MSSAVPGVVDMFAGALGYGSGGGGGVGWGVSASSSAGSGPVGYTPNFGGFGGINTGTQGLDVTTIALIAGAVLVAVLLLR